MKEDFLDEIESYSAFDLQLLLQSQADAYTPEEIELICETIRKKKNNVPRGTLTSGDWMFCICSFIIYIIGLIMAMMTHIYLCILLGGFFMIYVRWNHYQFRKKPVSAETLYSVGSFLYPVVGLFCGIYFLMMLPSIGKRCLLAALISVMITGAVFAGGFYIF